MANNEGFDYNRICPTQQPTFIIPQQVAPVNVGPNPAQLTCPLCKSTISTKIRHNATSKTHLTALCLCLFSCWLCCCIPYCMDSCRNANHYCPNCDAFIGTYQS